MAVAKADSKAPVLSVFKPNGVVLSRTMLVVLYMGRRVQLVGGVEKSQRGGGDFLDVALSVGALVGCS